MIVLKNIDLNYNNNVIFKDLNLNIKKSQKAVLSGQSGIGKSTILYMILGLIQPDKGTIQIDNIILSNSTIKSVRKLIAWLPQDFNIIGVGSVNSIINQIFYYKINSPYKPSFEQLKKYLELFKLDNNILNSEFSSISGGEKQRIGIIISLMLNRPILILDEPTSALDSETKRVVADIVLNNKDLTVLSSSHDPEWVTLCDIVYKIEDMKAIYSVV